MDVDQALMTRIIAGTAGTDVGEAVSWIERPSFDNLPGITLQHVNQDLRQNFRGLAGKQPLWVRIDVWAADYPQMKVVGDAVVATITPAAVMDNVRFGRGFTSGDSGNDRIGETTIFRRRIDYRSFFTEA